jgi:putative ABC transport system substrate-binding protein
MTNKLNFQPKPGTWLTALLLSILVGLLMSGCGAQKPKVYRVGVLSGMSYAADVTDGFKAGMAELGYVEGENIIYDVQATEFDMAAYGRIAQKFVADEVDLILSFPTEASLMAKAATQETDIPVVFDYAFIEGVELVESIREPGGNITGVRYPGPDIAVKRFEIMRALAPEATRMLVPYQRGYPSVASQLEILYPVAEAAGVTLIEAPADDGAELEATLQAQANVDAILFLAEPLAVTPDAFAVMGKYAAEYEIPLGGALISVQGHDSLFGVNVNAFDAGKEAARLADKVFRGTSAGSIPIVSADSYLQLNYKAAQELGLTMNDGLLSLADEIIR